MPALQIIQVGETPISSAKINLIIQALNGQGNTPVAITGINDPLAFALSLRNLDPDNGKVLIAYAADGVTELLRVDKNGVRLSPDGISQAGTIVTADAQQTLLQKKRSYLPPSRLRASAMPTMPMQTRRAVDNSSMATFFRPVPTPMPS